MNEIFLEDNIDNTVTWKVHKKNIYVIKNESKKMR